MSKFAGFIIGGIEVIAGVIALSVPGGQVIGTELIIAGVTTIAAQAVADLTMPKQPARDATEQRLAVGEQPRSIFDGEGFTAGSLVDVFTFGGKYGTDWEVQIIRLADERCAGLTQFKVNDTFYDYTGDGNYAQFDTHHFQLYFRGDTSVDPLPAIVTDNWPGYSAGDIGRAGCDVIVAFLGDSPTAKHPAWPGGPPTFGFVLKGGFRYDPRKDDTVGGSGSHRWDDVSTHEWSENPIVCANHYARGHYADGLIDDPTQLLVGRGLSAAEAPPAAIFPAANLCDETVAGAPRYRVAGPVYANQKFLDVTQQYADACAGNIVTHEGSVEIEPGQSKSIVATITDDDLLRASSVNWNLAILSESDPEWVNAVVANYVAPDQQWEPHDAPVARVNSDVLADGGSKEARLPLRLVKDVGQAQRIAEINRRLGRLWGRLQITLGPRFCFLEEGDWIDVQSDLNFNGATRRFVIVAYTRNEKWQITLTLREISADVYDGTFEPATDGSAPATPTTPPIDIGPPDSGNWTLTPVTLTDNGVSTGALELTGSTSDDGSVGAIVVESWKDDGVIDPIANPDDPPWTMFGGLLPATTTKLDITGLLGGGSYFVAVTYIVSGIWGDRLVLGPATVPATDISGAVDDAIDAAASAAIAATEAIAAAAFVNIYSSSGVKVRNANATDDTKPVNGFAPAAIANAATGSIRGPGGKISGLAGLTPGTTYFLGTAPGTITAAAPSGAGNLVQEVGVAVSATELLFNPRQGETLS